MPKEKGKKEKKSTVSLEFSTFDIPPSGDALILGKESPIGAMAAKKMLDTVAPGQFELVKLDDALIDGILIKKYLLSRADKKKLVAFLDEEVRQIMSPNCMITVKCDIKVKVTSTI